MTLHRASLRRAREGLDNSKTPRAPGGRGEQPARKSPALAWDTKMKVSNEWRGVTPRRGWSVRSASRATARSASRPPSAKTGLPTEHDFCYPDERIIRWPLTWEGFHASDGLLPLSLRQRQKIQVVLSARRQPDCQGAASR